MSATAWAEFLCGPLSAAEQALAVRVVGEPVAFEADDAAWAAGLFNAVGRRQGTLADCMIAAVAMRAEAQLATADGADFESLTAEGLRLVSR